MTWEKPSANADMVPGLTTSAWSALLDVEEYSQAITTIRTPPWIIIRLRRSLSILVPPRKRKWPRATLRRKRWVTGVPLIGFRVPEPRERIPTLRTVIPRHSRSHP